MKVNVFCRSDKAQEKYHTPEAKRSGLSQQVTTKLQGADKIVLQTQNTNNIKDPQKKHHLGTVSKKISVGTVPKHNQQKGSTKEATPWNGQQKKSLEGLIMFGGTNLTLIFDVNQDN